MKAPPQDYLAVVMPLIDKARALVEAGESLQPIAFVASPEGVIQSVLIDTASDIAKDRTANAIREAAAAVDAAFVFNVMEAWGLPRDKVARHRDIVAKYGSIAASPYRVDTVAFLLETRQGVWSAQPRLKPKGVSKRRRTFGPVTFEFMDGVEGRFAGLLPRRDEQALH